MRNGLMFWISHSFGAPGVEFYGQLDKERVISKLLFVNGTVS